MGTRLRRRRQERSVETAENLGTGVDSKPGAGLFKPKAAGKRPTAQKHVKVVDCVNIEHVLDEPPSSNEINMVAFRGSLIGILKPGRQACAWPVARQSFDGRFVCNRTCAGEVWI